MRREKPEGGSGLHLGKRVISSGGAASSGSICTQFPRGSYTNQVVLPWALVMVLFSLEEGTMESSATSNILKVD